MEFNRKLGHQELEITQGSSLPGQRGSSDPWQGNAVLMAGAAACACHGCCDGDWGEENERWDGQE